MELRKKHLTKNAAKFTFCGIYCKNEIRRRWDEQKWVSRGERETDCTFGAPSPAGQFWFIIQPNVIREVIKFTTVAGACQKISTEGTHPTATPHSRPRSAVVVCLEGLAQSLISSHFIMIVYTLALGSELLLSQIHNPSLCRSCARCLTMSFLQNFYSLSNIVVSARPATEAGWHYCA